MVDRRILSSPSPTNTARLKLPNRANFSINGLKTSKTAVLQLKIQRKSHIEKGWRSRDAVCQNSHTSGTDLQWKGYHRCRGPAWGTSSSSPTLSTPTPGICSGKMSLYKVWFWKLGGLTLGRTIRNWHMHKLTRSKTQHRGSSLKIEPHKDLLTTFWVCAERTGICRNFLWKQKC